MNYKDLKTFKNFTFLFLLAAIQSCKQSTSEKRILKYPEIKGEPVLESYFGKEIKDNYMVLENVENKSVQSWISDEKKLCDSILNQLPNKNYVKETLENIIYSSNLKGGFATFSGKRMFYSLYYSKEQMYRFFYRDSVTAQANELFNTDDLSEEKKTLEIVYYEPSYDGKFLAVGLASNGTEMTTLRIIDVSSKKFLPEIIERVSYAFPSWIPGKNAFFYTQQQEIKDQENSGSVYENSKSKIHVLGDDPKKDKEVFSMSVNKDIVREKIDLPFISVFPNTDKVLGFTYHGSTSYMSLFYTSIDELLKNPKTTQWKPVCNAGDQVTHFALRSHKLTILGFKEDSNGIIKNYNLETSPLQSSVILKGENMAIEDMIQTNNAIFVKKISNGISYINEIKLDDYSVKDMKLPFNGYAHIRTPFEIAAPYLNSNTLYYGIQSWAKELQFYQYDPVSNQNLLTDIRPTSKNSNADDLVAEEVEIPGHDGKLIPLSIIYSKNAKRDGSNPTLIEAYGAYGVSLNAQYDARILAWIKLGGIYAVAHVRGGGEKGDSWYKDGFKATKSNSWKDFISCAKYLIDKKYTSSSKLAATGGSAGGITIGMSITEQPELFKAAIIEVGALNALRLEKSKNSVSITEFGTSADSIGAKNLYDMDVYHHIETDKNYPSVLFTVELNDDRIGFGQVSKAVARFQEVCRNKGNMILLKVGDAGHGGDIDRVKQLTDNYSFLMSQLN